MMREYRGVKSRQAIEFAGWSGTSKAFLYAYRGQETAAKHRYYNASDIRSIRFDLIGIPIDAPRLKKIPPIINCRMPKGGTGKTTMTANIAACMAAFGHKVLMIDGDPQSSLTGLFGVDWAEQDVTHIGELMRRAHTQHRPEATRIENAVVPIYEGGMLDLIPADISMASSDGWLMATVARESAFSRLLESEIDFFSQYDVIIIDSAPSSSLLTTTFMAASQTSLAVVMPEGQSLKALEILQSNVHELNNAFPGRDYAVHIVVNRYNQSKKPHQDVLERIVSTYGASMCDSIVRDFIGFLRETGDTNAKDVGPVLEREPNSVGARDVIDLTKNLLKFYGINLTSQLAPRPA
jgi:chromosome partitioning protein